MKAFVVKAKDGVLPVLLRWLRRCFAMMVSLAFYGASLQAQPVEIVLWHAMAGSVGNELVQLMNTFNASQTRYVIKPVYKGSYSETLTAYAASYRVQAAPALLQVFDVGGTMMLHSKGVVKPVGALLREHQVALDLASWWPAVANSYVQNNELVAFPLNVSFPVMYYDADKLKALGYDAATFPKTWRQFETLLHTLKAHGEACAYTTAYPTWIHIESFIALHQLMQHPSIIPYAHPAIKQHLKRLLRWQKRRLFEYAGRTDEATILFTSRHCALFSQSSGAYQSLVSAVPFPVGVASVPYDDKYVHHRGPNLVGGGALWVTSGQSPAIEAGVAALLKFMLQPEVQAAWNKQTGYLPILKQTSQKGVLGLAVTEWGESAGSSMQSIRAQQRIRAMNDELIESLFAGIQTVEQTLEKLTSFSEYAQMRFEKNHGEVG